MDPNELEVGDYIEVYFPQTEQSQLAEVIILDKHAMKAEILPQYERNRTSISTPEQWQTIRPHSIFYQDLHEFGFNETSLEIAYGWTARDWTKVSFDQQIIYNLTYEDNAWRVEIIRKEGMRQHSQLIEGIQFIHELQHILKQYL